MAIVALPDRTHVVVDELTERLIRTRRRVEYVRAWLNDIETELVHVADAIAGLATDDEENVDVEADAVA